MGVIAYGSLQIMEHVAQRVDIQGSDSSPVPDHPPLERTGTGSWRHRLVPSFLHREKMLGQVVRFGIVGVLNTLVDYGLFNLLVGVFGVPPLAANPISVAGGILNSFLWNKHWTFSAGGSARWRREAVTFVLVSLIGLGLNTGGLWVLNRLWGSNDLLALNVQKLGASLVSLTWNFVGYRYLTFHTYRRAD